MVSQACQQVAVGLIGLRKHHVVGHGERVQQTGAGQILIAKHPGGATMQEGSGSNAAIRAVAGRDCLLCCAILAVDVARRAAECTSVFLL